MRGRLGPPHMLEGGQHCLGWACAPPLRHVLPLLPLLLPLYETPLARRGHPPDRLQHPPACLPAPTRLAEGASAAAGRSAMCPTHPPPPKLQPPRWRNPQCPPLLLLPLPQQPWPLRVRHPGEQQAPLQPALPIPPLACAGAAAAGRAHEGWRRVAAPPDRAATTHPSPPQPSAARLLSQLLAQLRLHRPPRALWPRAAAAAGAPGLPGGLVEGSPAPRPHPRPRPQPHPCSPSCCCCCLCPRPRRPRGWGAAGIGAARRQGTGAERPLPHCRWPGAGRAA